MSKEVTDGVISFSTGRARGFGGSYVFAQHEVPRVGRPVLAPSVGAGHFGAKGWRRTFWRRDFF